MPLKDEINLKKCVMFKRLKDESPIYITQLLVRNVDVTETHKPAPAQAIIWYAHDITEKLKKGKLLKSAQ